MVFIVKLITKQSNLMREIMKTESITLSQLQLFNEQITNILGEYGRNNIRISSPYHLPIRIPKIGECVATQPCNGDWMEIAVLEKLGHCTRSHYWGSEYRWTHNGDYHNIYTILGMINPDVAWLAELGKSQIVQLSKLKQSEVNRMLDAMSFERWSERYLAN